MQVFRLDDGRVCRFQRLNRGGIPADARAGLPWSCAYIYFLGKARCRQNLFQELIMWLDVQPELIQSDCLS